MEMDLTEKSRIISFFFTLFLGPLGLLYASPIAALLLILVVVLTFSTVVVPILCWILAIGIGDHMVYKHNKSIEVLKTMMAKS
jgi:hypothetical protein